MDRAKFYDTVRGTFGSLSKEQVDGFERILDEAIKRATKLTHLAYMFATVWWETARTMQPVREMGGEAYLRSKKYYPWVGEGLVQVTWKENHLKFGATAPGQMLTWPIALRALFDGMTKGMFTGRKLSDYLDGPTPDYLHARKIINSMDKAGTIAMDAASFEKALRNSKYGVNDVPAWIPENGAPPPVVEKKSYKPSIQLVMTIVGLIAAAVATYLGVTSQ